ncbi:MAG: HAD family phosphatase [Candidatus Rokubacteria bacterium]|nr:HAD family phosphatase [Candidatus Rokubacteria bacterium]
MPSFGLVVLDLDGTILDRSTTLDPALVTAVRKAVGRGCAVTLATGRMPAATRPYWEELDIQAPVILYNGALVRMPASGQTLLSVGLPPGLPGRLYPIYANAPVHPLFYRDDAVYCLQPTHPVLTYCREMGVQAQAIAEAESFLQTGSFVKCLFIGHPVDLSTLRAELAPVTGPAARLVQSRTDYLELLPQGVSKGAALRVVARFLEIPLSRTIAVGDQENDLEMLRAAGVGVAMPNSPPRVRAGADRVAPPPEAGGLVALLAELCPEYFG